MQVTTEPGNVAFNTRRSSLFLNASQAADTEIELNDCTAYADDGCNSEMLYHEAAIFLEVRLRL